jgi:hypothetical protein
VLPAASSHTLTAWLLALLDIGGHDMRDAILRHLTVAEAGRCLAGACRTTRDIVGAYEQWRPMWNSEDAVKSLRWHEPWRGWERARSQELESLVRLLADELHPQGVVSLRFCIASARAGTLPSLMYCHEMHVLQVDEYNERMRHEASFCFSKLMDRTSPAVPTTALVETHTSSLLLTMGLQQTYGPQHKSAAEKKTYTCFPISPPFLWLQHWAYSQWRSILFRVLDSTFF